LRQSTTIRRHPSSKINLFKQEKVGHLAPHFERRQRDSSISAIPSDRIGQNHGSRVEALRNSDWLIVAEYWERLLGLEQRPLSRRFGCMIAAQNDQR